jgi:hypothetical protein
MVGLETAEHLISQNRKATVVEMLDDVSNDISLVTKYFLLQDLKEGGVEIHTKTCSSVEGYYYSAFSGISSHRSPHVTDDNIFGLIPLNYFFF